MIIKEYEKNKLDINIFKIVLVYGDNDDAKLGFETFIKSKVENFEIFNYEEQEVLTDKNLFFENLLTKSFFSEGKLIIINRSSDKIVNFIDEISEKKIDNLIIVLKSDVLDKKSKLRSLFEKSKSLIVIAVYPDSVESLNNFAKDFFLKRKISISQSNINLITKKCQGNKLFLKNELEKLELYYENNKSITEDEILKLTNLIENYSISELVDNCLAKNKRQITNILNENSFTSEDCVIIIRNFSIKSKRILKLLKIYRLNKNLPLTINSAKPAIFWKDKKIVEDQILQWNETQILNLIFYLNHLELLVKKNFENSINIVRNFIFEKIIFKSNN